MPFFQPDYLPDPNDFSGKFNTSLPPQQEAQFQQWARSSGRLGDLYDYDLRGAWLAGAAKSHGHLPDTFKKPNHPTFSTQSKYHGPGAFGGEWIGNDFRPAPQNLYGRGLAGLADYFREVEPQSRLLSMLSKKK